MPPGRHFLEFLRVPALSAGLLRLAVGAVDGQTPHREDELYYVVRGRGTFRHGEVDRPVGPGDLLFVAAGEPHRFHSVQEELVVLAVFGPAMSPDGAGPDPPGRPARAKGRYGPPAYGEQ
ncbi:Cupin 2 conserved barrel domain protein [mine drainage metagenome]|uniref:Cupin 2 conserved barrel domain protein n=1 Tax=mine drainage metagenome TaxID=410659 RepID=T0YCH4_9ZZZZ